MTPHGSSKPESENALRFDEVIADAMRRLRNASRPMTSEALTVIEQIEADIADRQRERMAADMARWLDENRLADGDQAL